jgi:hypothetical protein
MSNNTPKPLSSLLQDRDSQVHRLMVEARDRVDLADRMRAALPPELAERFTGCNLRTDGTLVVLTTGPEWASRFRFEGDRLLAICRKQFPDTRRVRIGVGHPPR